MVDDYIKNRNSNNKVSDKSSLKDNNGNSNIISELNKSIIIPGNYYIPTRGSYQDNREGIEIKQPQISNLNNLDAKIKHKKLREGD